MSDPLPFYEPYIQRHFPAWGAARAVARERQNIVASVREGLPTRLDRQWSNGEPSVGGTYIDRQNSLSMSARGRNAYRRNPIARTLIQTETDNVIGDGLNFQPNSSSKDWNAEAKERYYAWLETASVRGENYDTGCEIERTIWTHSRVSGDIGWLLVSRGNDSFLQIIPHENIVTPDTASADPTIFEGIRVDQFGRPLEFFVLIRDERTGKRNFQPIPARDFVFLPHCDEPGQVRGKTAFVSIFERLDQADGLIDATVVAARMQAAVALIFKVANPAKAMSGFATERNSDGKVVRAVTLEDGSIKFVSSDGESVEGVNPTQPSANTDQFVRALYRTIGQPFDMPLEIFAKDMSQVTYASARIGLIPFYRSCRIKAARFSSRWRRTIGWWLSRERLRAPDDRKRWKNPFPADYLKFDLLVNAWPYTDPLNEAQTDLLEISMGTKSPQMVIDERGRDAEQIISQRLEWQEKTKELPAVLSNMCRDQIDQDEPDGDDDEPDDGNTPKEPDEKPREESRDSVKAYARAMRDLVDAGVQDAIARRLDVPLTPAISPEQDDQ